MTGTADAETSRGSPVTKARTGTVRRKLIQVPARIATRARKIRLRMPVAWPWQPEWERVFTAIHAPHHVAWEPFIAPSPAKLGNHRGTSTGSEAGQPCPKRNRPRPQKSNDGQRRIGGFRLRTHHG